jgi:hypothetical protein
MAGVTDLNDQMFAHRSKEPCDGSGASGTPVVEVEYASIYKIPVL